jgi:CheY-like chemotaxis protein
MPEKPIPDAQQKTVLLVEDQPMILRLYMTILNAHPEFRVLSASNGLEALQILERDTVNVLVTDLNMPVMDGFQLISEVHRRFPSLPIVVNTSVRDPRLQEQALELGALRLLIKPPRMNLLISEVRRLADLPAPGLVRGLGVRSLLQLLNWERKTCTLNIYQKGNTGHLYLRDGELIAASSYGKEGLSAAYHILGWIAPEVNFVEVCRVDPNINIPITEILMNRALMDDLEQTPE